MAGINYNHYSNKWSKFWATQSNALGAESEGNTGMNFPYLRYADVLLMYAEAVNEVENGVSGANGAKAQEALKEVRRRAFPVESYGEKVDGYVNAVSASKETFFEALFNERKWEFGGENMRWKDLVRWNRYAEVVYDTFWDYYTMGSLKNGEFLDGFEYYQSLPETVYTMPIANPGDVNIYQNTTLQILEIRGMTSPIPSPGSGWTLVNMFNWGSADQVYPAAEVCYSLKGYIRGGAEQNYRLFDRNNLPPVRYILPIPRSVILLSPGNEGYANYYGY
jgi:hypothetical protein